MDVEYIITEFGTAKLRDKSNKERALALDIYSSSLSIRVLKEQMFALTSAVSLNTEQIELINMKRREVFESEDYQEVILAFQQKRKEMFVGE